MADINNSIRIAKEFIMKWEKCFSASPNSNVSISKNADPSTKVYAYLDKIANVWTIGWGNTYNLDGSKVREGQVITKKEADDLIDGIIRQIEQSIRASIPYKNLTDNEYASIISISYNAGKKNLLASRIPDALNSNKSKNEIANIIQDSIVTSRGKFIQGLKNRRIDESKLFLGEYNQVYSYYLRNKETIFNYGLASVLLLTTSAIAFGTIKINSSNVASFGVTITNNTTPAVGVTLSGTSTYQQLKNSLGDYVYKIERAYLYSPILQQIQGAFKYSKYDSDGKQNLQSVLSVISPYQTQSTIFIDTIDKNLIIDGRDYVRFEILPNSFILIRLFCDRVSNADTFDLNGINNFKSVEDGLGEFDFFEQYIDIL